MLPAEGVEEFAGGGDEFWGRGMSVASRGKRYSKDGEREGVWSEHSRLRPLKLMALPSQRMTSAPCAVRIVKSSPEKEKRSFMTRKVGSWAMNWGVRPTAAGMGWIKVSAMLNFDY